MSNMKKIKRLIIDWFHQRVSSVTYNINFRTPDNMVRAMYGVGNHFIHFYWMDNPVNYNELEGKVIKDIKRKRKTPCVALNFYTSESVDIFIEHLHKVKANLQFKEASEIIAAGGEMEFVWDKESVQEYPNHKVYTARLEFKMPSSEQNDNMSVASKADSSNGDDKQKADVNNS